MARNRYRFDELFDLRIGGTPSRRNEAFWDKSGNGLPWVSIANLNQGLLSETSETITPEGASNSNVKLIPAGTTIISFKLSIGKKARLAMDAYTNEAICALVVKDNSILDEDYLFHAIDKVDFLSNVDQAIKGVTLNKKKLADLTISLPSLEEQRRIAGILSTWEKAINAYDRLIALKREHSMGLFLELTKDESELPLSAFCTVKKGKALSKKNTNPGDYPVIAGGKSSPYTHSEYNHENVITVSASGAYAGYVSFHPGKIWASDCSVVNCNDVCDTVYTFFALSSVQKSIYALQSGGAQPHVYPKDLIHVNIPVPERGKREALANLFGSYKKKISLLERKRDLLKKQKQGLMQQLLA